MKGLILNITCLLFSASIFGQKITTQQIDSINDVVSVLIHKNDNDSCPILNQYSLRKSEEIGYEFGQAIALTSSGKYYLQRVQLDTTGVLLNRANEIYIANRIFNDSIGSNYASLLHALGSWNSYRREYASAENHLNLALGLYKKGERGWRITLSTLGRIQGMQANYAEALEYFLQAQEGTSGRERSNNMGNIALCYKRMGQREKALKYLKDGLMIDIKNDWREQMYKLATLSTHYFDLNDFDSAIYYGRTSVEASRKFSEFNQTVISLGNLSHYYLAKGELDPAIQAMEDAKELADSVGIIDYMETFDIVKMKMLCNESEFDSALFYARRALNSAAQYSKKQFSLEIAETMSLAFEQMGKIDSALHYRKLSQTFQDSIYNQENQRKFTELYSKMDNMTKQKEVELLQKQKIIDGAKRNNLMAYIISILLISTAIVVILIYRQRDKQKRQKIKELELSGEIEKRESQLQQQTLHMINMNNNIVEVEENLKKMNQQEVLSGRDVQKVLSNITVSKSMDKEWQQFEQFFSNIHPSFGQKLAKENQKLTQNERRLTALIKMDLSNREIAGLLNIEQRSVVMSRYRLKRKLGLSENENLESYIQAL